MSFGERLQHAWNIFTNRDPTGISSVGGPTSSYRPDRPMVGMSNNQTIINSIINRIAMDIATININHVKVDDNGRFLDIIDSGLNECLSLSANLDQTSMAFMQDVVISMLDEGAVAIVPVDMESDPKMSGGFDIRSLRTGSILEWRPDHIRVRVYNEKTGNKEDIEVPKRLVCIIENPLYTVMNAPNSTMKRLIRKMYLLDMMDENNSSGKLDLIIQLPYIVKSEARRQQAENRRKEIEMQLTGSKYGIAYTDGTEKITQLNRPVENNLFKQVEYLTESLYSQLGITPSIIDGTADEKTMLNYFNRTIDPIINAIILEMKRKFLTKTARTRKQSIMYFRNQFTLASVTEIAEIADKFTRNEIASSNDIRQLIGWKPSDDPSADELRNKNLNKSQQDNQQVENNNNEDQNDEETNTGGDINE